MKVKGFCEWIFKLACLTLPQLVSVMKTDHIDHIQFKVKSQKIPNSVQTSKAQTHQTNG